VTDEEHTIYQLALRNAGRFRREPDGTTRFETSVLYDGRCRRVVVRHDAQGLVCAVEVTDADE
jgi:hypothetical protein